MRAFWRWCGKRAYGSGDRLVKRIPGTAKIGGRSEDPFAEGLESGTGLARNDVAIAVDLRGLSNRSDCLALDLDTRFAAEHTLAIEAVEL